MANPFYTATGNPAQQTRGTSSTIRAEFLLIQQAFALVASIGGLNSGIDTGTVNAIVITPNPVMASYTPFAMMTFVAGNTNTGATTINANGLGAIAIVRRDGTPLQAGDIVAGGVYTVTLTGSSLAQLQANPLSGTATGTISTPKGNSIASASTVNLDAATGNYLHITGTTTINAITLAPGAMRQVVFDSALTLTASPNLILQGGANIAVAAGDMASFYGDGAGVTRCVNYVTAASPSSTVTTPNGYIYGFTLSNDGTTPNTVLDIAPGTARDSANTATIGTTSIFKKSIAGTWVAGSGNNGMGTGLTATASTWYHVFAIINAGSADFYFDISVAAVNKPAGTTSYRYIGSIKLDGSGHILGFVQNGQRFVWSISPTDLSNTTNLSGMATLSVPPGFTSCATLLLSCNAADNNTYGFNVSSGVTGQVEGSVLAVGTVFSGTAQMQGTPSASGQVAYTSANNNGGSTIKTLWYINPHVAPVF